MVLTPGQLIKVDGAPVGGEQIMEDAGAIVESVATPGVHTNFPTEKAVRDAIDAIPVGGTVSTSGTPEANDFARFVDATDIEGLSPAEVRSALNVEDGADATDATNVAAAGAVMNSGDETIASVKTFSASPIVPTPTTSTQAANLATVTTVPGTAKTVPVGADTLTLWDSAATFARKVLSVTNLFASPEPIGATTPNTGSFSAIDKSGNPIAVNSGIYDPTLLAITYDAATRQFTVVNTGTTISVNGVISTPADETTTAHADTTAQYWAYYVSGATTLTVATTVDIGIHAIAGREYYNTDQAAAKALDFEERHSQALAACVHEADHETVGGRLVGSPLGADAADYTLQASTADTDITFSIAAGEMYDEDVASVLGAIAVGNYTIGYRAGLDSANRMDWDDAATLPVKVGGTYLNYNQNNAGTWQQTELANTELMNIFVWGWPRTNGANGYLLVQGQQVFTDLIGAEAEGFGDISFPDNFAPEQVPCYRFTFKCHSIYTGTTGKCRIEAVQDVRGQVTGATVVSGSTISHNTLANRDAADSHPEEAITAPVTGKTTPVDADTITLWDSAAAAVAKSLTLVNLLAYAKTYFDTLYGTLAAVNLNTAKVTNATHDGDVAGATTLTIANDAVTYAKMQNVSATARIIGRNTAGAGDMEELTAAQVLALMTIQQNDITQEINAQTGTTYTLVDADHGKLVTLTNASAITLTVPASLRADFECALMQGGAGQVTITASSTTINNAESYTKTAKIYAMGGIRQYTTNTFVTTGALE